MSTANGNKKKRVNKPLQKAKQVDQSINLSPKVENTSGRIKAMLAHPLFTAIVSAIAGAISGGLVSIWMNYNLNQMNVEVLGIRPVVVYHKESWGKGMNLPPTYGVSFKAIIGIYNNSNFDEHFSNLELDGVVPVKPFYAASFDTTLTALEGVPLDSIYKEYKDAIQRIKIMGLVDYPDFRNGIVLPARKTTYVKVSFFEDKYPAMSIRGGRPGKESLKLNSISKQGNKSEITGFNPDPKPDLIFHYMRIAGISSQVPNRLRQEFSTGDLVHHFTSSCRVMQPA